MQLRSIMQYLHTNRSHVLKQNALVTVAIQLGVKKGDLHEEVCCQQENGDMGGTLLLIQPKGVSDSP